MFLRKMSFWAVEKKLEPVNMNPDVNPDSLWVCTAMFPTRLGAEKYASESTLNVRITEVLINVEEVLNEQ